MNKIPFLLVTILFLTSCVTKSIVDEIQLVRSVSFDYHSENRIEGTAIISVHKWREEIESQTISATAVSSKDIGFLLNTKSAKPIHTGKLSTVLFSDELAKKVDLMEVIDTFTRDPAIGRRIYLAITEGPAKEMFKVKKTLEKDITLDIQKMIDQNVRRQNIPKTNLHLFLKQLYQVGQTPYLPYLRKAENLVQVDGVALLKDDRFVHKINLEEAFILKLLVESFSDGVFEFSLPDHEHAVVRNIDSYSKYHIEKNTNTPNISVTIFLKGTINEYTGVKITNDKIREINRTLTKLLANDAEKLIRVFQEKGIDPVGFGSRVKSVNRHFDLEEWNDYYKNADIQVKAKVIITGHGISK